MYFRDLRSNFWSSFFDKILEGSQSFYSTKVTLCYSNYRTKKSKTDNYVLYMSISSITHNFEWKNQEMISFENSQETHKYNQEFPSIHWKRDAELMELEFSILWNWFESEGEWKNENHVHWVWAPEEKNRGKEVGEVFQLVSFHVIMYIDVLLSFENRNEKSSQHSMKSFSLYFECFCLFSLFPNQEEDDLFIAKENSNNFIFLMWRMFMSCFHCCSSGEFPINRDKKDATIWKKTFNRLKTQNIY